MYAALVVDAALDLIGARDQLIVEGRFAASEVFVRTLASLRPNMQVQVAPAQSDVAFGALRLLDPTLAPKSGLIRVKPLDADLGALKHEWRAEAERLEQAA
jgi:hypothetical protein